MSNPFRQTTTTIAAPSPAGKLAVGGTPMAPPQPPLSPPRAAKLAGGDIWLRLHRGTARMGCSVVGEATAPPHAAARRGTKLRRRARMKEATHAGTHERRRLERELRERSAMAASWDPASSTEVGSLLHRGRRCFSHLEPSGCIATTPTAISIPRLGRRWGLQRPWSRGSGGGDGVLPMSRAPRRGSI
jgi:hypothetical protein